mgnify:CR=1 FL=1
MTSPNTSGKSPIEIKSSPNRGDPVYTFWYDKQTTGRYIKQATVGPAAGLRGEAAHHAPEVGGSRGAGLRDRCAGQGLDLGLAELLGEELGQDGGLRLLGGGTILAATGAVHLDALAALLDLSREHVHHLLVGEVAASLDLQVVGSGHRHP